MRLSNAPAVLEQFRKRPWNFQQTFETPLKSLNRFVETIFVQKGAFSSGHLDVYQAIFEPRHLLGLLSNASIVPPQPYLTGVSVEAESDQEVEVLLRAALADWSDFLFVPHPEEFVIYADHDEYITFYAATQPQLSALVQRLSAGSFKLVSDW